MTVFFSLRRVSQLKFTCDYVTGRVDPGAWAWHGSRMGRAWAWHGSGMVVHGSGMGPAWVWHGLSMGLAWVSHCVTMRHGSRMGVAWVGHGGVRCPCRHGHGMGMAIVEPPMYCWMWCLPLMETHMLEFVVRLVINFES